MCGFVRSSTEPTNERVSNPKLSGAQVIERSDENPPPPSFWSVSKGFPRRCDWLRFTDMAKGAKSATFQGSFFFATWPCCRSQKSLIFPKQRSIALLLFPHTPSQQRSHWPGESPKVFTYANARKFLASSFQNAGSLLPRAQATKVLYRTCG